MQARVDNSDIHDIGSCRRKVRERDKAKNHGRKFNFKNDDY